MVPFILVFMLVAVVLVGGVVLGVQTIVAKQRALESKVSAQGDSIDALEARLIRTEETFADILLGTDMDQVRVRDAVRVLKNDTRHGR